LNLLGSTKPGGRHGAKALTVPACVTLVPLPPRSLELNPAARPDGIEQNGPHDFAHVLSLDRRLRHELVRFV
jgi:hypothetical protein